MKKTLLLLLLAVLLSFNLVPAYAATTVSATNHYAYGGNIGWIETRGDITNGAVFGQSYCTGYLWSANCGWISLGNGPTNGWQYSNTSAADWGVNNDGLGNLSGYAWGANIGWLVFEQTNGMPRIDLQTGNLDGYVWGANVGWISLSNLQAFVQVDRLDSGPDSDADGVPDPWEYQRAGNLITLSGGTHDADSDGMADHDEYLSDTDPTAADSVLQITSYQRVGDTNTVTWSIEQTRFYRLEHALNQTNDTQWSDSGFGRMTPDAGSSMTRRLYDPSSTMRFFRVRAFVPLSD